MTAPAHIDDQQLQEAGSRVRARLGGRSVVLVGMMGAGKSSVGRRLAKALEIPFVDSDTEIEKAASMTIPEIFATRGEPEFRAGERRVVSRLLDAPPSVIATGGGAFMDETTREKIRARGISVWLKAEVDVLLRRVKKRGNRPLLKNGDPEDVLRKLLAKREPVYAEANITVMSRDVPHEAMVAETLDQMLSFLDIKDQE
ncbi:shikimate kinase [Terrihabitans soli]|uniref:Shikimate kinase n=1 Tax=Terrihabitans soli TaxID=708113 RepID=A0A6S6QR18_9HYPH|nr:shikimate kinase [Terrihabitans soli]BCJ89712.1 shikimate kinase [Terrihabitans soli]